MHSENGNRGTLWQIMFPQPLMKCIFLYLIAQYPQQVYTHSLMPPPIFLSFISKNTTRQIGKGSHYLLTKPSASPQVNTYFLNYWLFGGETPIFFHLNYSSISSVGRIRLCRKVDLVQSGAPGALKSYHMGTCLCHLCFQIGSAITLTITQITPSPQQQ